MKIKQIEVYQYNELSEKAKQRARDWLSEVDDMSFDWECLQEDAKTIGIELTGVDDYKSTGEYLNSPYEVIKLIKANHGEQCDTYKTALEYEAKFNALPKNEDGETIEDEDLEQDFLNSILEDYRIMWGREIEYHYSDEYVNDTMEANEYEFDINGKRI